MRIVIVRHGEPDYEKDCLTIEGRKQAELAAKRLIKEHIEKIYSSPLGRARETAEAFSNLTGMKPVEILDFMKEIRYGREDDLYSEAGHPWSNADKIAAEGKDLRDPNWRELPVFIDNTATVDVDNVIMHTDEWLSGLGYVREGLYYRNVRPDDKQYTVALFCHGGSATAMLSHIYNQEFPYLCSVIHMAFTGITVLRFDSTPGSLAMPVLELLNDDRHLIQE